ncbi:DUF1622 domain-containing protein [Saccharospirillum salsuginis]|uniref:DUF1622 domain-containing protein n=1 Tax=Saccharospirillum salsuginis TaxID=418750 RepID=A0A918K4A9_9GAMM|nr:DUF1622 domain-containing protein [Saccharospirillum salsuginis]GGX48796.1 hypothetical protein GCM10007392_14950 [Saccharospirillum salsuginis]
MESEFIQIMTVTGYALEAFGVLVVLIGSCLATAVFVRTYRALGEGVAYKKFRQNLGRSIILGLEFMIAGDIIRTVIVADSLQNVGILAVIVLIRTFLSLTLFLEVEGRWPWQKDGPQ